MNDVQIISIAAIALYILMVVYVGWRSGKGQNHEGFIIGNRGVGLIPTAASIGVGWRDASFILFWLSLSYTSGWAVTLFFPAMFVFVYVVARFGTRFRVIAKEKGYITPGQMVQDEVGPLNRKAYGFIVLAMGVMFAAAQLFVVGQILSATVGLAPIYIVPTIACVVGVYLWFGGYNSVIKTDTIQFFVVLSLLLIIFFIPAPTKHLIDVSSFGSLGFIEAGALIMLAIMNYYGIPDIWQRLYSAKDDRTIRIGLPMGAFFFCLLTMGLVYTGFALRDVLPGAEANDLFTLMFTQEAFSLPVLTLMLVVIFAAGMSTLDSWAYLFSSTLMRDFIDRKGSRGRDTYILLTRFITALMLVAMCILALNFQNIMNVIMGLTSVIGVAAPMFLAILLGWVKRTRANDIALFIAMLVAFIVFVVMFVRGDFASGFLPTIIPSGIGYVLTFGWLGLQKVFVRKQAT